MHAHDGLFLPGVNAIPHHLQHLVGHEVLAGAVSVYDGLDKVLGHVLVVRQQPLGVHSRRLLTKSKLTRCPLLLSSPKTRNELIAHVNTLETHERNDNKIAA